MPHTFARSRSFAARLLCGALLCLVQSFAQAEPPTAPAGSRMDAHAMAVRLHETGAAPAWLDHERALARQALELLGDAAAHGLDPGHYRSDDLVRQLDALRGSGDAAPFERALTTAMLQYLADLHFGRTVSPYRQAPAPSDEFNPAEHLRLAVHAGRLAQAADTAAPAIPLYRRVKEALAHYRTLALAASHWPALPAADRPAVVAGGEYAGTALLRERLRLLGDLGAETAAEPDNMYTPALADAVRRFQSRHGLAEDGVVGADTIAALSVPLTHRVTQLALTLERLRWLPPLSKGPVIAVNLPTYRLWAFPRAQDSGAQPIEMRIIVGKAAGTPTPLFIGQLRYLEFNPYWNVPRSIAIGEIVPKLARNPAYLRQNDMELLSRDGQVLAATGNDAVARLRSGAARVRQRPGAKNVLGEVKFAMPNPMNIYLHSTASKALFGRARRDLSHGCIRVERPAELAQFVLGWDAGRVAAAMRPGPTRTVQVAEPVPVVLFYATAVSDHRGHTVFAADIYGRDEALIQALRSD